MVLADFGAEKYERSMKEEGRAEERAVMNKFISAILSQNRIDDLNRAAENIEFQEQLIKELVMK